MTFTDVSDVALLELTRDGVSDAFGELWARHHGAVMAAARSFTSYEPDDLVQEAFARVYSGVVDGRSMPISFRAYVATTARRIAIDMSRRDSGTYSEAYEEDLEHPALAEPDFSEQVLDNTVTTRAFRSLPTRQREVLWYRDVEDLPVQEISRYVGMTPNATTVLIKRAREAFKVAWINAQLSPERDLPDECRAVVPKLAKYSRETLTAAERARITLHLGDCVHCAALASEADDLHRKLALVLLPLLLLGGASSYLRWIQDGENRAQARGGDQPPRPSHPSAARSDGGAKPTVSARKVSTRKSRRAPRLLATITILAVVVLLVGVVAALAQIAPEVARPPVATAESPAPRETTDAGGMETPRVTGDVPQIRASLIWDESLDGARTAPEVLAPQPTVPPRSGQSGPPPQGQPAPPQQDPLAAPTQAPTTTVTYPEPRDLISVAVFSPFYIVFQGTPGATITIEIVRPAPATSDVLSFVTDATGEVQYDFAPYRGTVQHVIVTQTYMTVDGEHTPSGAGEFLEWLQLAIPM